MGVTHYPALWSPDFPLRRVNNPMRSDRLAYFHRYCTRRGLE